MDAQAHPVDLIIPARDEQANIPSLLAAMPWEQVRHVIVVDNGSRDETADRAAAGGAIVVSEPGRGYGAACLAGLAEVERRIEAGEQSPSAVAFVDADLSDDPGQLPRLLGPIRRGAADLVIGTRADSADPGALDAHQRLGNWLACRLIHLATGRRYRDLGPMRAVRWDALQRLHVADRTWGWTVEMQFKAAKLGLQVVEMDVPYQGRRAGRSKISGSVIGSVKAGTKILTTIGALWWRSRKSK